MKLAQETIPPNEATVIAGLIRTNLKTRWSEGSVAKRGQHGKHHGCVEGIFRVRDDLPDGFEHGVFQPGHEYSCLIRFSNGLEQDDSARDVRGMAIKLLGVPGRKLLPGAGNIDEHDFILVDHPTYFTPTMADYVTFNRHFTPVQDLRSNGVSLQRLIRFIYGYLSLLIFHNTILQSAKVFAGRRVGSVLGLNYHSTTAYLFGKDKAVKYKAVGMSPPVTATEDKDALRNHLWATLKDGPASFDFGAVIQSDTAQHPVEDPSIDWEANGANFVKLAEIKIAQQDNSTDKDAQADALRFNSWLSLPEHRPLGHINRARRDIYAAMSANRMNR